ncbi:MAG: hypothetical protein V4585_10285 [Bacteroidota bacterium]|jgi:hypothetical protein
MATPLTLYIPIKQNEIAQLAAKALYKDFMAIVTPILTEIQIVHYARLILIPNASGEGINAITLITVFDGAMNPYLNTFWDSGFDFKALLNAIAAIAVTHPPLPILTESSFENFINSNNLSQPADLYQAYNDTVVQVIAYNQG